MLIEESLAARYIRSLELQGYTNKERMIVWTAEYLRSQNFGTDYSYQIAEKMIELVL